MPYFVLGDTGERYGPADLDLLNEWIRQGRLTPSMKLEDTETGAQVQAASVPGLAFPIASTPIAEPPAPSAPPVDPLEALPPHEPAPPSATFSPEPPSTPAPAPFSPQPPSEPVPPAWPAPPSSPSPASSSPTSGPESWSKPPTMTQYPRSDASGNSTTSNDLVLAWVFGALTLLIGCFPWPIVGLVYANKAKKANIPSAQAAYYFNVVLLILWCLGIGICFLFPVALSIFEMS